jgi:hypothetical protein
MLFADYKGRKTMDILNIIVAILTVLVYALMALYAVTDVLRHKGIAPRWDLHLTRPTRS